MGIRKKPLRAETSPQLPLLSLPPLNVHSTFASTSPRQDIVLHKSEATENTPYFVTHGVATLNFNRKSENIRKQG